MTSYETVILYKIFIIYAWFDLYKYWIFLIDAMYLQVHHVIRNVWVQI